MKIYLLSPLTKVFSDEAPENENYNSFSMLKNERTGFNLAVLSEDEKEISIELKGDIAKYTTAFAVQNVPVKYAVGSGADEYYLRKTPGLYPDVLMPFDKTYSLKAGEWQSFYFEVNPCSEISGKQILKITVDSEEIEVCVNIADALLPKQSLKYTNWYHSDCLCDYYGIKAMGDEYWRINRNFIRTAVEHGQNIILTPLFTPPLDTKIGGERTTVQLVGVKLYGGRYLFDFRNLKKWIDMCLDCGIEYFEMSHMFTQWGAKHAPKIVATDSHGREKKIFGWFTRTSSHEYDDFLRQFGKALKKFIFDLDLQNRVYFHISDEPSERHLKTYMKRASLIREIFGEFPVMDALSDYEFFKKGTVTVPVPCENSLEEFLGNVKETWTYYCCGPSNEYYPNRFIAMPLERVRIIGILLYKYDVKGFLQWGYNFYNSQYSLRHINPFENTDADGHFPAGDSFVVYPAKDGTAIPSIRLKAFFGGIQDYTALQALENKIGREKVLELIGDITFTTYPHSPKYILELREKVNSMLVNI